MSLRRVARLHREWEHYGLDYPVQRRRFLMGKQEVVIGPHVDLTNKNLSGAVRESAEEGK